MRRETFAERVSLASFEVVPRIRGSIPTGLCTKLVHNFTVRADLGKGAHVFEIASGVTRELRKLPLKVVGKTVDDLRAPALAFLISQDVASNFPIMQDKLGIGCECGLDLDCSDALLIDSTKRS